MPIPPQPLAPAHPAPSHATPGQQATVGAAGHEANFPPFAPATFGPQLIWLALTFGFLYWMLSKRLLPQISRVIEDRADGIRGDLTEAEHLRAETEASLKGYETALTAAKTDAAAIAKSQSDALAAQSARERAAVDTQMAAKISDAEQRIASGKATALAAVNDVAGQTVGAIVAKLTGLSVTGDEVANAIAAVKAK